MRNAYSYLFLLVIAALLSACGGNQQTVNSSSGSQNSQNTAEGGKSCTTSTDCDQSKGETCVASRCTASASSEGKSCTTSTDCDQSKGETCVASKCTASTSSEGKSCTVSTDCDQNKGETCVASKCTKGKSCTASTECNRSQGELCIDSVCIQVTSSAVNICDKLNCEDKGMECKHNTCVLPCDDPCNGVCCGNGEVCVQDSVCKLACSSGRDYCGLDATSAVCCPDGEGCFDHQCKPLKAKCDNTTEFCPISQYCAQEYGACVSYKDNENSLCLLQAEKKFEAKLKLHWYGGSVKPEYNNVMSMPVVADVDGDGISDIIFNTYRPGFSGAPGVLRVISGKVEDENDPTSVKELWHSTELAGTYAFWSVGDATPAVGDIDGDGKLEIVTAAYNSSNARVVRAVDAKTGQLKWESEGFSLPFPSVTLANLDRQGAVEVIVRDRVLDGKNGKTLCTLDYTSNVPIAADLDDQGNMEIIMGLQTYSYERPDQSVSSATCKKRPTNPGGATPDYARSSYHGLSALADIIKEVPGPEIVLVDRSWVYLADSNGKVLAKYDLPGSNNGGAPTLADFDGDDQLEIGVADSTYYIVLEYKKDFSGHKLVEKWKYVVSDASSGLTGSSVFDFDGDGKAEVAYNDEYVMRILDGDQTGDVPAEAAKLQIQNPNWTLIENPVVVDIDRDGHADIISASSTYGGQPSLGIRVFTDAKNRWVPTRSIWNQHAYHYTNVNDDGSIPLHEDQHWKKEWSNNFRQNVQKGNSRLAPNLVVTANSFYDAQCGDGSSGKREISYTVHNKGSRDVAANAFKVGIYVKETGKSDSDYTRIAQVPYEQALPIGAKGKGRYEWEVPPQYSGKALDFKIVPDDDNDIIECVEEDAIEQKNVSNAAADLKPNIPNLSSLSCSGDKMTIHYEVANTGAVTIPANSFKVVLYAGPKGAPPEKFTKHEVMNKEEITANGVESFTYEWEVDQAFFNQALEIRIVVDPDDQIVECSEDNNEFKVDSGVHCYTLG